MNDAGPRARGSAGLAEREMHNQGPVSDKERVSTSACTPLHHGTSGAKTTRCATDIACGGGLRKHAQHGLGSPIQLLRPSTPPTPNPGNVHNQEKERQQVDIGEVRRE